MSLVNRKSSVLGGWRTSVMIAALGLLVLAAGRGWAQTPMDPDAVAQAAATITAAELAQHVRVLAADSMRERPTPSPQLEQTARYIAAEFQRLGLRPGLIAEDRQGGDSTWFQRYPVPGQRRLDYQRSHLIFDGLGGRWAPFTSTARFYTELGPPVVVENALDGGFAGFGPDLVHTGSEETVVVSGRQTAATVARLDIGGKVVLYLRPPGPASNVATAADSAEQAQVLAALYARSAGVVVVTAGDSAQFAATARAATQVPLPLVDEYVRDATGVQRWPWAVAVWQGVVQEVLAAHGLDLAALRADPAPRVTAVPKTAVWLDPRRDTTAALAARMTLASNVLGLLEGADSARRGDYVLVSAHMDGAGGRGAADNAVGVAALLALARAWSMPGARPKRSVLFVATSGAGPGQPFWGANVAALYRERERFAEHDRVFVANLTLDRLDQVRGDSVTIDGLPDVATEVKPAWLAVAHPELNLHVVDGGTAAVPGTEAFAFVRFNVPSLYVHAGPHGVTDSTADRMVAGGAAPSLLGLDLAAAARVTQLVCYLGYELATAKRVPSWTAEGRDRFLALQPGQ